MELDINKNRTANKYDLKIQIARVFWFFGNCIFRLTPRPFYKCRRIILRLFGAKIGHDVNISNTTKIYFPWNLEIGDWSAIGDYVYVYNLGLITIGEKSTISHMSHLCAGTHDYSDPTLPLLKTPIFIGSQVWICAEAFIGPGAVVSDGAIVGARAVVNKKVPPSSIVIGNPSKILKERIMRS